MKKQTSYLRLCNDPELEKESQKVTKGAILITTVTTIFVATVALIIVVFG